jgi:hypothetical protein
MEKLELKHLAPYLPYGLKVMSIYNEVSEINSINYSLDKQSRDSLNLLIGRNPLRFRGDNLDTIKPILRPLSDLTKEIEYDGETITPCIYWDDINIAYEKNLRSMAKFNYSDGYMPYFITEKLLEWHFDVFGLIEKGLAIDINTL